ncbi:hypothetical protein HIM_00744 [Hirsutella minnesotensis 3608]|nr:hypothetical protein HIM_00744 [Hirsutella minnesotensis 3608]
MSLSIITPVILVVLFFFGIVGFLLVYFLWTGRKDSNGNAKIFGLGPAFVTLKLEGSKSISPDIKRLRFYLPSKQAISGLPLTSTLLTMSFPKGQMLPVIRPYTPISPADKQGYLDLLIKRYPTGKASTHLHSMAPGQTLLFMAALPGYSWKPNARRHITAIAGGSGISPIYQLVQGIMFNPEDRTAVTIVFGVRNDDDVIFEDQFNYWAEHYPNRFKAVYAVSQPTIESQHRKGYITKELLQEVIPLPKSQDTMAFVSGPPAMEKSLVGSWGTPGILQQLGFQKSQIHKF